MKAFALLLVFAASFAHAEAPNGVECMKRAKELGFVKLAKAYQACSVSEESRKCIFDAQEAHVRAGVKGNDLYLKGNETLKNCKASN